MPIFVECDECGKKYRLQASMAGERIPCRECGASIRVPGGRRDAHRSGPALNPAIIGGVAGFAVVVLLGLFFVLRRPAVEPAPVAQPQNNAANGQLASNPLGSPTPAKMKP